MTTSIRACCTRSVALAPAALAEGIAARLETVTRLLTPARVEEVADALPRLQVEPVPESGHDTWHVRFRQDSGAPLRLELRGGKAASQQVADLLDELREREEPAVRKVREVLARALETFSVELKGEEAESLALPVAVAAAAWIAEHGHGLVQIDGRGWMAPAERELQLLLEE